MAYALGNPNKIDLVIKQLDGYLIIEFNRDHVNILPEVQPPLKRKSLELPYLLNWPGV